MRQTLLIIVMASLSAASGRADPPVTSADAASPANDVASRWVDAAIQARWVEFYGDKFRTSEALRMLVTVQNKEPLRSGVGWYDPGQRRHDWGWLSRRFDANRNGQITRDEFPGERTDFVKLDRDRDGIITADDLNWSESSPWVKQDAQALRLFRTIDEDGNGKISDQEMAAYFQRLAGEKRFLNPDDVRRAIAPELGRGKGKAKRVSDSVWLNSLFAGDLGSPREGPRVGQMAPDFTLSGQDGKKTITLSDFERKSLSY